MGRVEAILAAVLVLLAALTMAGCAANKSKSAAIVVPPAPLPSPAAQNPAREPLSVPQTQVQLPPPQPVNLDALAVPEAPAPPAPAPPPKPVRRTPQPSKPEPVAPAAQPPEPERAPIQEILSADERRRFQESAEARKRDTRQWLEQAKAHRLTADQRRTVARIQSFLTQSDDAQKRGDMRQADALAERGLVLAKELAGGK